MLQSWRRVDVTMEMLSRMWEIASCLWRMEASGAVTVSFCSRVGNYGVTGRRQLKDTQSSLSIFSTLRTHPFFSALSHYRLPVFHSILAFDH